MRCMCLFKKAKTESKNPKVEKDIKIRCYQFSLEVIKFLKTIKYDNLSIEIVKQLII